MNTGPLWFGDQTELRQEWVSLSSGGILGGGGHMHVGFLQSPPVSSNPNCISVCAWACTFELYQKHLPSDTQWVLGSFASLSTLVSLIPGELEGDEDKVERGSPKQWSLGVMPHASHRFPHSFFLFDFGPHKVALRNYYIFCTIRWPPPSEGKYLCVLWNKCSLELKPEYLKSVFFSFFFKFSVIKKS